MQRKSVLFWKEQVKQAMSYTCSCSSEFSFQYQIFCVPFAQNIIKIVVKKEISDCCFHQGAQGTRKVKEPVVIVGSRVPQPFLQPWQSFELNLLWWMHHNIAMIHWQCKSQTYPHQSLVKTLLWQQLYLCRSVCFVSGDKATGWTLNITPKHNLVNFDT